MFPPDTSEKSIMFGNMEIWQACIIIVLPKRTRTIQPNHLTLCLTCSLLIMAATPKQDNAMYIPSTRAIAKTNNILVQNPCVADELNTIKHIGPIANCNSIPNLKPFNIMINSCIYLHRTYTVYHYIRIK